MTGLLPCSLRAPLRQDLQVSTRKLPIFTLSVSEEFLLFHYICYIFNKHIYTYLHNIYYLIAYWLYFNLLIWNVSLITSSYILDHFYSFYFILITFLIIVAPELCCFMIMPHIGSILFFLIFMPWWTFFMFLILNCKFYINIVKCAYQLRLTSSMRNPK